LNNIHLITTHNTLSFSSALTVSLQMMFNLHSKQKEKLIVMNINMKTKAIFILMLVSLFYNTQASTKRNYTVNQAEEFNAQEIIEQLDLPEVTITSVTQEKDYAPHVLVAGLIGKNIKFELRLPDNWNGKFVMGGGGGFVGSVINIALDYGALQKGYATVGTDTGHEGHPIDASWAFNNMEAILNFGHLAVHRTAVNAKALIEKYYTKEISYSYFVGCSRGGGQALMEAQRYPDDFDGIIAGAPAYNWTHGLGAVMTQNMRAMYPDPANLDEPMIREKDLELIESTYLAMCDELDGIKDGIVNNPLECSFNLETLLCPGEKTGECLTAEQIEVLKVIYGGPVDSEGNKLYYGFPLGGETDEDGWFKWLTGGFNHLVDVGEFQAGISSEFEVPLMPNAQFGFGCGIMQYLVFHDTTWSYVDYDYNNLKSDASLVADVLNATSPDLSEFRNNGGKLLMYTGWSDAAISALGTIGYYEDVLAHDSTAVDDVKLFMMPGVLHCAGGIGPWFVNWIDEIDNWVANQQKPEQITVHFVNDNLQPDGSRLLCPYPEVAIYDGKGNTRVSSSFECGCNTK